MVKLNCKWGRDLGDQVHSSQDDRGGVVLLIDVSRKVSMGKAQQSQSPW